MMMMMMMMMMPNSLVEKLYMYILAYLAFRPKTGSDLEGGMDGGI